MLDIEFETWIAPPKLHENEWNLFYDTQTDRKVYSFIILKKPDLSKYLHILGQLLLKSLIIYVDKHKHKGH